MSRRLAAVVAAALIGLAGCSQGASPSVLPSPGSVPPTATPQPTQTPEPTPSPSPTASPTPDQANVPIFTAGAQLKTRTTVRLRDLPGTDRGIQANLPPGALVQAVLGPVRTDGYGWYLVRDVDPAEPTFIEGWVAAGFEPSAFLAATGANPSPPAGSPVFIAGYAQTTSGDFGPIRIEGSTALRWAVALPIGAEAGASCNFSGSLKPASGSAVTFLATTVSQTPQPGTTQPTFFAQHDTLTGDVFLHVDSDCSWAVTVVRLPL